MYTQRRLSASSERVQLQKVPVSKIVSTLMFLLGLYLTRPSKNSSPDLKLASFTSVRCDADTANVLRPW